MVDNKEATEQRLSADPGSVSRGIDWTSILKASGLESPGYHETIAKMIKDGKIRTPKR